MAHKIISSLGYIGNFSIDSTIVDNSQCFLSHGIDENRCFVVEMVVAQFFKVEYMVAGIGIYLSVDEGTSECKWCSLRKGAPYYYVLFAAKRLMDEVKQLFGALFPGSQMDTPVLPTRNE